MGNALPQGPTATHAIIVKAYIWRNSKCLLLRRRDDDDEYAGFWDTPGGHLKPNEGALTGLYREIWEETGLACTKARPLSTWDHFKGSAARIGISFLATDPGGDVTLSAEHDACKWVGESDVAAMPMAENLRREILWVIAKDWHR